MKKKLPPKEVTTPPIASVAPATPSALAINDQMRPLLQQLGMHYSNRERSQKSIDVLEAQLDGMKAAIAAIQKQGPSPQ